MYLSTPVELPPAPILAKPVGVEPENPDGLKPRFDEARWKRVMSAADAHYKLEGQRWDRFLKLYRDGGGPTPDAGTDMKHAVANLTFAYVQALLAFLYVQAPSIEVDARDNANGISDQNFQVLVQAGMFPSTKEAKIAFADTLEDMLTYSYDECGSNTENRAALFDAIVRGMGITKQGYDVELDLDRCDCIRREELFVDPNARYSLSQAGFVVHTSHMSIDRARAFFKARGITRGIEPNYRLKDVPGFNTELKSEGADELDLYRFHETWYRADDKTELEYRDWKTKEVLGQSDAWPFSLPRGKYPFTLITFQQLYARIHDPFTDLHTVDGLRKTIEDLVEFFNRSTRRSIAKKLLVDEKLIPLDKQRQIENPEDFKTIGVQLPAGASLDQVCKLLEFNAGSDTPIELADKLKQLRSEVLGLDELMRGLADRKMTATQADILDKYGQQRLGDKRTRLDDALIEQCRQRAMIARQLISPEKVAKVLGQQAAVLWQVMATNPDDLLGEYTISIAAGSTSERAKQQRIQRLQQRYTQAADVNQRVMAPVFDLAAITMELWRADGERRPQRFLTPPQPMPPPPPVGAPPMQPQAQAGPQPMPGPQPQPAGVPA